MVGITLSRLGQVAYARNSLDKAEDYFQQALAIAREVQNRQSEGWVHFLLGQVANSREQWEAAATSYLEAVDILRDMGDMLSYADASLQLGILFIEHLHKSEEGCLLLGEAIRICQDLGL